MSHAFDFSQFLNRMIGKSYDAIIKVAEHEASCTERSSYKVQGAVNRCKLGSADYVGRISQFLFFMRCGMKPSGVGKQDWQQFRRIAEALVESGEFTPEVLQRFEVA